MARIVTQQLWLTLVNLIQNSMTTNYSFQDLASDLSNIRSEISGKCNNFNPAILDKLNSAQAWAEVGQHEQSLGSLYTAYQELAAKYLSDKVSLDVENYLMDLLEISQTIQAFGDRYESILRYGVGVDNEISINGSEQYRIEINQSKQYEIKELCNWMLQNELKVQRLLSSKGLRHDVAKEHITYISKVLSLS